MQARGAFSRIRSPPSSGLAWAQLVIGAFGAFDAHFLPLRLGMRMTEYPYPRGRQNLQAEKGTFPPHPAGNNVQLAPCDSADDSSFPSARLVSSRTGRLCSNNRTWQSVGTIGSTNQAGMGQKSSPTLTTAE
ncbi:hypothetical protein PG991_001321 [Apiospora marii]|uniref:Uncharacterized protein n=1 Tax=Apiospora marii TaxID=335849 RepID=A0ABR1SRQ8_9PEZI